MDRAQGPDELHQGNGQAVRRVIVRQPFITTWLPTNSWVGNGRDTFYRYWQNQEGRGYGIGCGLWTWSSSGTNGLTPAAQMQHYVATYSCYRTRPNGDGVGD